MEGQNEWKLKIENQLKDWEMQLDTLKEKAKTTSGDLKIKYEGLIVELEPKIDAAKAKLKEIAGATDEVFDQVKESGKSIWEQVKNSFDKIKDSSREDGTSENQKKE